MYSSTTNTKCIRRIRICETIRMLKTVKQGIALVFAATCALFAITASAATTITIDSVAQRWPWNNKIDITYTVTGGQDLSTSNFCKLVFTTAIAGTTYTIDGVTNVGASVNSGTHTVTWTAPSGVRSDDCTISAAIYASDTPSGDDYMVIDLDTGLVSYEGLLASQEDSNGRYNTDIYKTDKLVLRKVPAGGPYPTGDSDNFPASNSRTNRVTKHDYYIGVFPVTQAQYMKIRGNNPSAKTSTIEGNNKDHRPVESISWTALRGTSNPLEAISPNTASGASFLQRLNGLTLGRSGMTGFDLPTEIMFEIAQRAGATGMYAWEGSSFDSAYAVTKETSGDSTVAVGSRLPNVWGLYDTTGNVFEWCLDSVTVETNASNPTSDLAAVVDPFTPSDESDSDPQRVCHGGGEWKNNANAWCRASNRYADLATASRNATGFRIAIVMH